MFRVSTTPIIRSTQNCNYNLRYCAAISLQRGQAWPCWRKVAAKKIWPVPEAVVTVLCSPDDGCSWHPKHVEWTCRITNRLLCVASPWKIINIYHKASLAFWPKKAILKVQTIAYRCHCAKTVWARRLNNNSAGTSTTLPGLMIRKLRSNLIT